MSSTRRTILHMVMQHRRGSENQKAISRHFTGENDSKPLIELLNGSEPKTATSRRRVEKLFETVSTMLSFTKNTPSHMLSLRNDRKYESLIRSLNRQLRRYKETRTPIFVFEDDDKVWVIDHVIRIPGIPRVEANAVDAFKKLALAGVVNRVRRCNHCRKWILARFPHQLCCSAYCRERLFRSSDVWKAKRRRKAKEYYWLHKNKNTK